MNEQQRLEIILDLGKTMLANGAETYRVEDTVTRVASAKQIKDCHVFAIPTGIFFSYISEGNEVRTIIKRVFSVTINLEVIDLANEFARRLSEQDISYNVAKKELHRIYHAPRYSLRYKLSVASLAGAFFVLMFGGNWIDSLLAYITSILILLLLEHLPYNFFIKHLLGGLAAASVASGLIQVARLLGASCDLNLAIIGPLMLLVPGVPLTVGIRDIISGELIAGSARIAEALFTAIAIAFGVGIIIYAVHI